MYQVPQIDDAQRRAGFEASLRVRRERAELKRQLAAREITLEAAVAHPAARTALVMDLLRALPGVATKRARLILEKAGLAPQKKVSGLGSLQTEKLLDAARFFGKF